MLLSLGFVANPYIIGQKSKNTILAALGNIYYMDEKGFLVNKIDSTEMDSTEQACLLAYIRE